MLQNFEKMFLCLNWLINEVHITVYVEDQLGLPHVHVAFASEILENHEEMFSWHFIENVMFNIFKFSTTHMLPIAKELDKHLFTIETVVFNRKYY